MPDCAHLIDDCWNRIGIFGLKSCPRLPGHIHCRNCEVYSEAASVLRDACAIHLGDDEPAPAEAAAPLEPGDQRSVLVFRLGDEWLALPTLCVEEVLPLAPVHRLPHLSSRTLLGVANLHGALVACVALPQLLGLDTGAAAGSKAAAAERQRGVPRLLSLSSPGGALLAPVDEVDGIHLIAQSAVGASTGEAAHGLGPLTGGVMQRGGRSITLLDGDRLQQALSQRFQ